MLCIRTLCVPRSRHYQLRLLETSLLVLVKWSRYRPGVAQRVSRFIALLFHDCGTRRGWVVSSTPRPHLTPRERPSTHCTGGWVGTRAGMEGRKIMSLPEFDPGTSSPQSVAIPTELPGPPVSVVQDKSACGTQRRNVRTKDTFWLLNPVSRKATSRLWKVKVNARSGWVALN